MRPVLIGFADALAAPEAAWSLLESGVPVVAFARRGSRPSLRRCREIEIVYVTAPEDDARASVSDVAARLADGARFRAVMPLDDAAVWLCDELSRSQSEVQVAGPTDATAAFALDKRQQIAAAAQAGLAVPATTIIESREQIANLEELPVVLKAARPVAERDGRLLQGSGRVCGNRAELERAAAAWDPAEPLLAQPFVLGVGEGLFGLCGPDGLAALSAHRRLRMMNPQGSGSSACVSIPVDPELAAGAERMLTAIGWRGLFMLEFLRDGDGTAWFMELNGRTWGSTALARRLGLEYPAWTVAQLQEPDFVPGASTREGLVCRHLGRELVYLLMVLRGPRSVALTRWPGRGEAVRDVSRIRRSDRWYNWRAGDTALFVDDTLSTVLRGSLRLEAPMSTIRVASHVHSDWSYDGRWSLEELAAGFARRGYHAVLMAEHDRGFDDARWAEYRQTCAQASREILLVPGIEYSDPTNSVHVPVWGDIPFIGEGLETAVTVEAARRPADSPCWPTRDGATRSRSSTDRCSMTSSASNCGTENTMATRPIGA